MPKTRLVGFASPTFHYPYRDRRRWEDGLQPLPMKIGSLQKFLHGYENASRFFQRYALPGRPRDLLERDLREEHKAHKLSRRKPGARLRMIFIAIKRLLLCRYGPGPYGSNDPADDIRDASQVHDLSVHEGNLSAVTESMQHLHTSAGTAYPAAPVMSTDSFHWTPEALCDLRLELEKLIVFDFLMRNTDRGLDNFMIKCNPKPAPGERYVKIGAIDNSLSFPHQHPQGLRDYPYGWLFLPASLIGQPFSDQTRATFLPKLTDPVWWAGTIEGLRRIFSQDVHFHERQFQNQMDLLRGQGWLIVQCLLQRNEGPIELCARPKCLVRSSVQMMTPSQLSLYNVTDLLTSSVTFAHNATNETEESDRDRILRVLRAPQPIGVARSRRKQPISPWARAGVSPFAKSMPTPSLLEHVSLGPPAGSEAYHDWAHMDPRAIEIVEQLYARRKQRQHQRRHHIPGHFAGSTTPLNTISDSDTATEGVTEGSGEGSEAERVHPLDLAMPASVPVLVDRLENVSRKTWLSFN